MPYEITHVEHDDKALPIDIRTLAQHATRCHAFAKALHYKEIEFKKHAAEIGVSEAGADAAVNAAAAFGSSVGAQAGGVRDEQTRSRFTSHWMKAAAAGKGK